MKDNRTGWKPHLCSCDFESGLLQLCNKSTSEDPTYIVVSCKRLQPETGFSQELFAWSCFLLSCLYLFMG